jgi:hypothetical protein
MVAEQELTRLIDMRVAFETQPDISAIWQGYIDQRVAAVSGQRDVIERLKAKLDGESIPAHSPEGIIPAEEDIR